MKSKQMYNVCEIYHTKYIKATIASLTRVIIREEVKLDYWKSTPIVNVPYSIAKFKKRIFEVDKKYPKGTWFKIVKNGENPLINYEDEAKELVRDF